MTTATDDPDPPIRVRIACKLLSDEQIADAVYRFELPKEGLARKHFNHYRTGGGADLEVDIAALLERNHFIRFMMEEHVIRYLCYRV